MTRTARRVVRLLLGRSVLSFDSEPGMINELLLLLVSSDAQACTRLGKVGAEFANVRVHFSADEVDLFSSLQRVAGKVMGTVMILSWGMSADFVRLLKSNGESQPIPLIACLPASRRAETDALYDAGANCVVELEDDHAVTHQRLRNILNFWSRSATLPSSARAAQSC
jgi:hypothetical protein